MRWLKANVWEILCWIAIVVIICGLVRIFLGAG